MSLLLLLLCRPYARCDSINQFRSLLAQRFIQRVFHLSYGKQRGASVDILYELFEKLDPTLIEKGVQRHLQQLRRRGLIGKQLRGYFDSTIIEKSPNSTFEKAAWIKIRWCPSVSVMDFGFPVPGFFGLPLGQKLRRDSIAQQFFHRPGVVGNAGCHCGCDRLPFLG